MTEEQWQKIVEWASDPIVILILAFIGTNILLRVFRYFFRSYKGRSGPHKGG
jgi:hypothetical protein